MSATAPVVPTVPTDSPGAERALLAPTIITGASMALYLLVRPYGDGGTGAAVTDGRAVAEALSSGAWIAAHVAGAVALAAFAALALRLADIDRGRRASRARAAGLIGAALVLPYYGAETFGLHAIGSAAFGRSDLVDLMNLVDLVDQVRYQPVAMATFAVGLIALAISGLLVASAWACGRQGWRRWAAWPLGLGVALVLPQFYLPPVGRMAFGVAYLVASLLLAAAVGSAGSSPGTSSKKPNAGPLVAP